MRMRFLSPECRNCIDNEKSISYCYDVCGIPVILLEDYESRMKELEEKMDAATNAYNRLHDGGILYDKSQH